MTVASAAVLAVGAAGAMLMLHGAGGKARDRADARYCGLVTCAALQASDDSGGDSGSAVAIGNPAGVKRLGHTRPAASRPSVTITYSTPAVWDGGFQGEYTIVNHGNSTLENWRVVIALPGDQVNNAWDADWRPGRAGTVILTPASYDAPLKPGASQQLHFVVTGPTVVPASCAFDGFACT